MAKVVCITVSDRDIEQLARVAAIPWTKITEDERLEFERQVRNLGTAVAFKISRSEWREE